MFSGPPRNSSRCTARSLLLKLYIHSNRVSHSIYILTYDAKRPDSRFQQDRSYATRWMDPLGFRITPVNRIFHLLTYSLQFYPLFPRLPVTLDFISTTFYWFYLEKDFLVQFLSLLWRSLYSEILCHSLTSKPSFSWIVKNALYDSAIIRVMRVSSKKVIAFLRKVKSSEFIYQKIQ